MDELQIKIISKSEHKNIQKNEILLRESETCNTFVFLKRGIVRHSFSDVNGKDITKNFIIGPAYFFYSLSSFISQESSSVQCEALTEVELYEMKLDDFNQLLDNNKFYELWSKLLTSYIVKKEIKELSFMKDDALKRYELFLKDFPGLLNQIPHYYIASYLSISPETLSRIRKTIS